MKLSFSVLIRIRIYNINGGKVYEYGEEIQVPLIFPKECFYPILSFLRMQIRN